MKHAHHESETSQIRAPSDGECPPGTREIQKIEGLDAGCVHALGAKFAKSPASRRRAAMRLRSLAIAFAALLAACQSPHPPLEVVEHVDLDRYTGKWYEIASFPQYFQRGCAATTATYSLREDGRLDVLNECRDGSLDGKLRRAEGIAWVANPSESNAKLKVQFFWPFRGDYWIIELDADYQFAVIGHPSREYLWILARTRTLKPEQYTRLLERIEAHGYALDRLNRTLQPTGP